MKNHSSELEKSVISLITYEFKFKGSTTKISLMALQLASRISFSLDSESHQKIKETIKTSSDSALKLAAICVFEQLDLAPYYF
ncbi:hypothetical protein OAM01_01445 [bacterium]|nr:hypothetical protein [bacterium]